MLYTEYNGYLPKELATLVKAAKAVESSKKCKEFLWKHTVSEAHYDTLIDAIRKLADMKLVQWK